LHCFNRLKVSHLVFNAILGFFASAKPASQPKESIEVLEFVKNNKNLRQVFTRNAEDGLYPKIKAIKDLEATDIPELTKLENWQTIS
jgi:hypothetical protein